MMLVGSVAWVNTGVAFIIVLSLRFSATFLVELKADSLLKLRASFLPSSDSKVKKAVTGLEILS